MYQSDNPTNIFDMKIINKTLFTTLLGLLCTLFSYGQDVKKVAIGLYGSGNIAWLKPDIDGKYGYNRKGVGLGYNAGVELDFALFNSNNYAFTTGVGVLYHSAKLEYPDVDSLGGQIHYTGISTTKYKLSYINIPVILKLKTNEIGYLTYYIEVGSSIGIKYKARQDNEFTYTNEFGTKVNSTTEDKDMGTEASLFRFPLVIGAGAEYNLSGNTSIVVGLTYNNGFTNVFAWGENNPKVYDYDDSSKSIVLKDNGTPASVESSRKAISNFIGLKVGIKF
jgi:hypothetical protein